MQNKLNKIINELKPMNSYQEWALKVPIRINMRDKCYSEVIFYLKDAFGIEVA